MGDIEQQLRESMDDVRGSVGRMVLSALRLYRQLPEVERHDLANELATDDDVIEFFIRLSVTDHIRLSFMEHLKTLREDE